MALVVADACLVCLAVVAATVLRYNLVVADVNFVGVALILPWAVGAQLVSGLSLGLYQGRWRFASFDEAAMLAFSALGMTAVVVAADAWLVYPRMIPLGAALVAGVGAFVLMGSMRYLLRLLRDRRRYGAQSDAARTLVFGAGEGGYLAILAMRNDPASPYLPVGLLDDDPSRRNLHMLGVRVLGDRSALAEVAQATGADTLLIAIPSAGSELIEAIEGLAMAAGLAVKVLPPLDKLYGDKFTTGDIRDVTLEDLLGRHQVKTDLDSVSAYVTGKRVLVTGAGGSIGSELCRQLSRLAPAELIMLDRDESALHALQLSIEGRAMLDSPSLVLADIRDKSVVHGIFQEMRPEVVFHAAALKHLTLLERYPAEAIKTNVWGTLNVLEAADACGVGRFVNVSTDKAADPVSVLGYSKRLAERLTADAATRAQGVYLSVRFGNVLGSRGSVLDAFRCQVKGGGPLTVTDPEVTRYFMTVEEAVALIIQAGAIGSRGEALVLDMGKPVKIADVAARLAAQSLRPLRVVFTGLRPGEKLHEVLFGSGERGERRVHPLVSHVPVTPLGRCALANLGSSDIGTALVARLTELCSQDLVVTDVLD